MLINLYTNAVDAIGKSGGFIELSLDYFEVGDGSHSTLADGSYLRLVIRDNGPGMTKDIMEHVFDPFFTTKGVGDGTGLGLSMVHSVVEAHGGMIDVASTLGVGTTLASCRHWLWNCSGLICMKLITSLNCRRSQLFHGVKSLRH